MPGRNALLPVAIVAACLTVGCAQQKEVEVVRPVKTVVVSGGYAPAVRTFPGKVEASRSVDLAFQVPGLLVVEPGKEGQRVAKGQVIAQLRQEEFQARLVAAQSQLHQASASLTGLQAGERSEEQLRRESQLRAAQARVGNA